MPAFWEGLLAGYGIAIPVGAIAILIVDTALQGGFRPGFFAGAGAASADFFYALLLSVAGGAIAGALAPYSLALGIAGGALLIVLGGWGLWRVRTITARADNQPVEIQGSGQTYAKFLSLTLINPATVAYFAALILGNTAGTLATVSGRILFVIGAALASLSWQTFLAGVGALGNRFLSPRFRVMTNLIGNLVVIGLGVRILVSAVTQR